MSESGKIHSQSSLPQESSSAAMESPGSAFSSSESSLPSESRLSPPTEVSSSRATSKKRKIEDSETKSGPRLKRLKSLYNDRYRTLLNETVNEIHSYDASKENSVPPSQIGVTQWTSAEKAALFYFLGKRGRHDLRGIAANIGSKSESEIHIYLELLRKATIDQQAYGPSKDILKFYDNEAAVEISHNCCIALDLAGEALSLLQQREEEKQEQKRYCGFWILTPGIARWVDQCLDAGEKGECEVSEALPAATFLNLRTFLSLSKRIFMNSSNPENNWRTHTERSRPPMVTHTAFSDFYTMANSITKRLVQTSLFFAMSRHRATDTPGKYKARRHVRRRDIVAALNVLGMAMNGKSVWAATARRCRLRIYDQVRNGDAWGKRYSYDEVEAILNSSSLGTRGRYRTTSMDSDDICTQRKHETNYSTEDVSQDPMTSNPPSSEDSESSAPSDEVSSLEVPCNKGDKKARKQERVEQAQDAYVEVLDQKASRSEERRLWEMLGEDPMEEMENDNISPPQNLNFRSKDRGDRSDWKDWVDYAGDWETLESPVPESSFVANRTFGKKRDLVASLTETESSSEDTNGTSSSGGRILSEKLIRNGRSSADQSSGDDSDSDSDDNSITQ